MAMILSYCTGKKILLCLLLFMMVSCQDQEEQVPERCKAVNCTMMLITVTITIKDRNGNPIALDSYYSKNLKTKKTYYFQNPADDKLYRAAGTYPVISDGKMEELSFNGSPIEFTGLIRGKAVVRQLFEVARDCCHIYLISGEPEVVI